VEPTIDIRPLRQEPRQPASWVVYSAQTRRLVELVPKQWTEWSKDPQPVGVIAFLPTIPQPEIIRQEPVNPACSGALFTNSDRKRDHTYARRISARRSQPSAFCCVMSTSKESPTHCRQNRK